MNKLIITYIFLFLASLTMQAQNPLGGLKKAQDAVKGAQDAAGKAVKGAQDAAKGAQDAAGKAVKGAQDAAKGAQDAVKGAEDAAGKAAKEAQEASSKVLKQALQNLAQNNSSPNLKIFTLSPDAAYTDTITLSLSSGDVQAFITFTYDQAQSTVNVKMESDQILHVFRRDANYKDVIHYQFPFKPNRLKVFKLPYKVDVPADGDFKLSKITKKALGPRSMRKRYTFHQWDEISSIKPVSSSKYAMVNDRIEQTYTIDANVDNFTFTLHDVMVLTHNPKKPKKFNSYIIEGLKDFNIQYMAVIMRDPCKDAAKDIEDMTKAYDELSKGLAEIAKAFPQGIANGADQLKAFQTTRNGLLQKYTHRDITSQCTNLQDIVDKYNACVDSLMTLTCDLSSEYIQKAESSEMVMGIDGKSSGIDASTLLFNARQIDELVTAWKTTRDQKSREAYKLQCDKIIQDIQQQITGKYAVTKEQKDAVNIIRKAIEYYNNICK